MEDVVLHYKPGPSQNRSALIQTTERLLAPFPCRPPQIFSPWFPSIVDRHLPLRPARRPPVIISAPDQDLGLTQDPKQDCVTKSTDQALYQETGLTEAPRLPHVTEHRLQPGRAEAENKHEANGKSDTVEHGSPHEDREVLFVPETPPDAGVHSTPASALPSPNPQSRVKRCWTVLKNRDHTKVQPMSRRLHQTVSKLRLQARQRVKWVINEDNCRDIEQIWRALSRADLSRGLPSCNAHIDRLHAEVWVYCDLMYAEQVGLNLKQELNLRGSIHLWARTHGHIYTV